MCDWLFDLQVICGWMACCCFGAAVILYKYGSTTPALWFIIVGVLFTIGFIVLLSVAKRSRRTYRH